MRKLQRHFLEIVKRMLVIGAGIQILLGACWLIGNFTGFQEFGDSYRYLEISKNPFQNGLKGIGYPLLLRLVQEISGILQVPYYCILYLIQLTAACCCGYRILKVLYGEKGGVPLALGTGLLVTMPLSLQCHLAVLPNSLTGSLLLLLASFLLPLFRRTKKKGQEKTAWTAWNAWNKNLHKIKLLIPAGAAVLCIFLLNQSPRAMEQAEKSMDTMSVSRFVWPYFGEYYSMWPEEVRQVISWEDAISIDRNTDTVRRVFVLKMEEALGEERANALYREMTRIIFANRKKSIAKNLALDGAAYTVPQLVIYRQLMGDSGWIPDGGSYTIGNYQAMRGQAPEISKYYMRYGCLWYIMGSVLALLSVIAGGRKGSPSLRREALILVGMAAVQVLYHTMQGAGMMDYKNSLFVISLWGLWMFFAGGMYLGRGEGSVQNRTETV